MKPTFCFKNIFLAVAIVATFLLLGSCARKVAFLTSSVVPAARGSVKVTKDNNDNYVLKIQLSNLAESSRLQPAKGSYVVWISADGATTKNMGQIKSGTHLMSKNLTAAFESVSAFKPTKVFITAEDDPAAQYPSRLVVLTTDSF